MINSQLLAMMGGSGGSSTTPSPTPGTLSVGTEMTFRSVYSSTYISVVALSSTVALVHYSCSAYPRGEAVALTLNDTTLTAGNTINWPTGGAGIYWCDIVKIDSTHALGVCRSSTVSYAGAAVHYSLTGTDISAANLVAFGTGVVHADDAVCLVDSGNAIAVYTDESSTLNGKALCLSISGANVTANASSDYDTGNTAHQSLGRVSSTVAIVCYADEADSGKGKARLLTLSGTSVSAGNAVTFESHNTVGTMAMRCCMLDTSTCLVAYRHTNGATVTGSACILTISGSTITATTPVQFDASAVNYIWCCATDSQHGTIAYQDVGDSSYGKVVPVSWDGSTLSVGSPVTIANAAMNYLSISAFSSSKMVVAYTTKPSTVDLGRAVCVTLQS